MMTKERLEELIKNRATVYYLAIFDTNDKEVIEHNPSKSRVYRNLNDGSITIDDIYDKYWFESREEAKWAEEFGCIERTERLELPTWEEVSRDLQNVPAGNYVIKEFDDVSLEYIKYRNGNYAVIRVYKYDNRLELEATKENYIKACRKAKELFLGERK